MDTHERKYDEIQLKSISSVNLFSKLRFSFFKIFDIAKFNKNNMAWTLKFK